MKWGYYVCAAATASYFLLEMGAPWYTVCGGVLLAGHWNWRRMKRAERPQVR